MNEVPDDTVLIGKADIQEQFGVVIGLFKKFGEYLIELVALLDKQELEQLIGLVVILEVVDQVKLCRRELKVGIKRIGNEVGFRFYGILGGKHTDTAGQVVVDLHKAHSDKAVKPSICNLLDNSVKGFGVF